jgi:hypothetical protein
MPVQKLTLELLLVSVEEIDWKLLVFWRAGDLLHKDMICYLLEENEFNETEDAENDRLALSSGCSVELVTSIGAIQDVKSNLLQQLAEPTISDLIQALSYYIENDSFIVID